MIDFVKTQQQKLIKTEIELTREKNELFQRIDDLKQSLTSRTKLAKEERSKTKMNPESLTQKMKLIEEKFIDEINDLEKKFKKVSEEITTIRHDIKIMDMEIKYFQSEKFINESEIEKLHIKNHEITTKKIILEKEKNKNIKNIFLKIISLGFYNRKKSIINQIDQLNLELANNDLLIGLKLWQIEKVETKNQKPTEQLIASANNENQPSTSNDYTTPSNLSKI